MGDSEKQDELKELSAQMKADWDRRVSHDYRFWMSDGYADDASMWSTGERDLNSLIFGIEQCSTKTLLEIGSGVGRLLKPALSRFAKVIGFDVSEKATHKARELIGNNDRLTLVTGDGFSLKPIDDRSVDVVISFASLMSMPTDIVACYLVEAHRVLKLGASLRIQIYLGTEQLVCTHDTLALRSYRRERFIEAMAAAGFAIEEIRELKLPIEVSSKEAGFEALIVSLRSEARAPRNPTDIAKILLPEGEQKGFGSGAADLESWMSLHYADELASKGDMDRARQALEYALSVSKTTTIDTRDLLQRIVSKVDKKTEATVGTSGVLAGNLEVVRERFPKVYEALSSLSTRDTDVETRETQDGPVVFYKGQCLDHPQKPLAGAESWVKRSLQEKRVKSAKEVVVFGFGGGYHVEAFLAAGSHSVALIEPSAACFKAALESRDLTKLLRALSRLDIGLTVPSNFTPESELVLRPQSQVLHPEFVAQVKSAFYGVRGLTALHPRIGVLGPLQGGTLPITAYTMRALGELNQRVRELDMSGFSGGYHHVEKLVFDKFRVAGVHGAYIQMMSQVVFESINEKPVDILICMAQAPFTGQMLTELRKRGVITVLWFLEDYLRFTYWKDVAQYFDFVFTIQKGQCIEAMKAAGAGEVHYLPPGCDPFVHAPAKLTPEDKARWGSPVSFVGAGYHNRQQMFAGLADLPFKIWGTEWPTCRPFDRMVQEEGRRLTPGEYIKIFNSTDINLNLHSSTERDGVEPNGDFVNPRTYELAASGSFQLVDERQLLPDVFKPGEEVITFKDVNDLKEKISYYRAHPEERARVIEKARARAVSEHTYVHRMKDMLSIIYNSRFEQLKRREEEGPWGKMLQRATPHPELLGRCEAAFKRGEEPILDGLVADIVNGKGKLTETEQKLLFLYHVRKQIIRMKVEELGDKAPPPVRQGQK